MNFCNQNISKTITARSFKLAQLIEDNLVKNLKKIIFILLAIALCKFCHRKLEISKTVSNLR